MSSGIFLGFGSNQGEREKNLEKAIQLLSFPIRLSSTYETEPVDYLDQPWFLNIVGEADTRLAPFELLNVCQEVEQNMGRLREIPKGPRIIDIDILFYGDLIRNDQRLILPHPALTQRKFVLQPLAEIAPDFVHPVLKRSIRELLAECPDRSAVRIR